ncbi:hypothetical protein [Oleiagrimonas sp. C23AA]|uniref:hypothetical protein n=1 Tax=Oleiagrimonas sp. C23AA TaxID=2719047 RepID=UPI00141DA264|nr:hypothetical protein [Oleiagrimonas sp. C23AA]NII09546.1 hypothetical protein [Oleiagrimonas sp. C23AA]
MQKGISVTEVRRIGRAGPWSAAFTVVLWHLLSARLSVHVPFVFGDEAGYLTKAAALAGHFTDAYSSYYPGYALLIAPWFLGHLNPGHAFEMVQVFNALLAGLGASGLWVLAGEWMPESRPMRRWVAVVVVGMYPPWVAYSGFALSENALIVLIIWQAVLVCRQAAHPRARYALALGWLGGFMWLVHPRGGVLLVVGSAACLFGEQPRRQGRWSGAALLLGAAVFVVSHTWLDAYFKSHMGYFDDDLSGHYPGLAALWTSLAQLLSVKGIGGFASNAAGQVFYLLTASAGLAGVGALALVGSGWQGRASPAPARRALAVFAMASTVLLVAMTAFFMRDGARVDQWFYGRYAEVALPVLMLPGLLCAGSGGRWLVTALLTALLAGTLMAVHGAVIHGWVVQVDVLGWALWNAFGVNAFGGHRLGLWLIGAGSVGLMLLLAWWQRTRSWPLGVAAAFLACSVMATLTYLRPLSDQFSQQQRIPRYLKQHVPGLACVNEDRHASEYWEHYNLQVFILPMRLHPVDLFTEPKTRKRDRDALTLCSRWLISTRKDLATRLPSARLVVHEYASGERLWRLPDGAAKPPR